MKKYKTVFTALLAAGVLTLLAGIGILDTPDYTVSDALYQRRSASDGQIVLVGIDDRAIDSLGPYGQWNRDIIALVLDALNESEECRPAAIGIDVLYAGESYEDLDEWLAESAGRYGNVVTACAAQFGTAMAETGDGNYYLDDFSILAFEEPYDALRDVTTQGHINAMLDADGILRHHLLRYTTPDGRDMPSMALALAQMYYDYWDLGPVRLPPVDGHNFWYVPFCGTPGDFDESISVADLINGDIPADYFAGKVVFIGPYTVGLQDNYVTSIDHAQQMFGVEYQANAVQALLWGQYKREAGNGVQLAVLFAVLLLCMWGFWKRKVLASTILWAVLCGGWTVLCLAAYRAGLVLHVLWVPVGATVLYAVCLAVNYIRAAAERRQVTNTFKRYVAPEIVNELLKEGTEALELGGKLTTIAVLFVDVRGFTTMSEMLEPPQVVAILNRYLTLIADCILKNGGTLDKFVGDAAMAFWGAPLPQDDYIMKACQAAADMVSGSETLSKELMEQFGRTVSFGIGVHVGEAVVGNIGSPQRMDYTAIGDTVNTSARLEANAPGSTIYISRAVADALEGRIRTTSLGDTIKLKGKKDGFEILTLDEIIK
ncbi:MAG: adenylate/guanylate cyclase domain-containing protein [Oscillospiraceae bacterium]|nr:adenylate/guanylate cyclase domain-containing protein [Oscillospiraceae bacterium]